MPPAECATLGRVIEHVHTIHYPEGDTRDVGRALRYGVLVDINGGELGLPLASARMIAYRVWKISGEQTRNQEITHYWLEQVYPAELRAYAAE
ncbi:MAG: hypothetical protein EA384_08680 [Spirochaetaceae bacterium]|nr:MAG: hypothetical protein EA384_08680 [Spirochaetaceae bacterium]